MSESVIECALAELRGKFSEFEITIQERLDSFQQEVAELRMVTGDQTVRSFLKCYVSHGSWWTGHADDIFEREVSSIDLLASSGLSVPEILYRGQIDSVNWFLLGDVGGEAISTESPNFDPERLGKFLARMHDADISGQTELTVVDVDFIDTHMREMAGARNVGAVDEMKRIVSRFDADSDLVFCHGDLNFNNFVVYPNGDFGALDFEETIIGYRQYDVARLGRLLVRQFGEDHYHSFHEAYATASGYRFEDNLIGEWMDFATLRDGIVALYLNHCDATQGLSFAPNLFDVMFRGGSGPQAEIDEILARRRHV